jgi:hypothetical protein
MPGGRWEKATAIEVGGTGGVGLGSAAAIRCTAAAIGGCTTAIGGKPTASGWRVEAVVVGEAAVPQATKIATASKSTPILAVFTSP